MVRIGTIVRPVSHVLRISALHSQPRHKGFKTSDSSAKRQPAEVGYCGTCVALISAYCFGGVHGPHFRPFVSSPKSQTPARPQQ